MTLNCLTCTEPRHHLDIGTRLAYAFIGAEVAQAVEQRTENPRVGGSTPSLGTTFREEKILAISGCPTRYTGGRRSLFRVSI